MLTYQEIRAIRKEVGITQKDFADLMGIPIGTWSNVELGNVKLKTIWEERAMEVFSDLGINVEHILNKNRIIQERKEEERRKLLEKETEAPDEKILEDIEGVDFVNHPPHYADRKFEVIDIIEDSLTKRQFEGYLTGNIIKYIMRYERKGAPLEDLEKAKWYLERLIALYK